MLQLQLEVNFIVQAAEKRAFAEEVKIISAAILGTGYGQVRVTIHSIGPHDRAAPGGDAVERAAFVTATLGRGETSQQQRRLSLAFIEEIHQRWQVARSHVKVVLSELPDEICPDLDPVPPEWVPKV